MQPPNGKPSLVVEKPVETARQLLGQCLGKLQDISYPGVNVQTLIEAVAETVRTLFGIRNLPPLSKENIEGVKRAMNLVSRALAILQDTDTNDSAVYESARILARVLSILHPISKMQLRLTSRKAAEQIAPEKKIPPHPKRTMPRIGLNVDIGIQTGNNFYTGFTEDISEGGLFVATYDFKPIGTKLNVTFTLPNGHIVMATGTVRWIREFNPLTPDVQPGMGIQFDELSPQDRNQINEYIRKNAPIFYEG